MRCRSQNTGFLRGNIEKVPAPIGKIQVGNGRRGTEADILHDSGTGGDLTEDLPHKGDKLFFFFSPAIFISGKQSVFFKLFMAVA